MKIRKKFYNIGPWWFWRSRRAAATKSLTDFRRDVVLRKVGGGERSGSRNGSSTNRLDCPTDPVWKKTGEVFKWEATNGPTTFILTTLSIDIQLNNIECHYAEFHYAECHYAECHYTECSCYLNFMLIVIMLNVIMLSVVRLKVFMLSVVAPLGAALKASAFLRVELFQSFQKCTSWMGNQIYVYMSH